MPKSVKRYKSSTVSRRYRRTRRLMPNRAGNKISGPYTAKHYGTKDARNSRWAAVFGRTNPTIQSKYLPFTESYFAHLPYVESQAITTSSTTGLSYGSYTYNLTGPYDPRIQLGGGQPTQWDQTQFIYERYWVRAVKFSIVFTNPSQDGMYCGFRVRNSTDPVDAYSKDMDDLRQLPNTKVRYINNSGGQVTTFKGFVRPWDILGVTKGQYNNMEYSAQMGAIPSVNVVLEPFAGATDLVAEVQTIRCSVKITYYIQMTNRQTVVDV